MSLAIKQVHATILFGIAGDHIQYIQGYRGRGVTLCFSSLNKVSPPQQISLPPPSVFQ